MRGTRARYDWCCSRKEWNRRAHTMYGNPPMLATHLPARCRRGEREWRGAVLSLSENGCLLRTPEPVKLGSEIEISFDLPRTGTIETKAETAYQLVPDTGLIFHRTSAAFREAILSFVEESLAAI